MNVLYLDASAGDDRRVTLLTERGAAADSLGNLKALARKLRASGPTILVTSSELQTPPPIPEMPDSALSAYMDSNRGGLVSLPPDRPLPLSGLHSSEHVTLVRAAARNAGLKLTHVLPLASAALRAVPGGNEVVVLHLTDSVIEVTSLYPNSASTRIQARSSTSDPAALLTSAVRKHLNANIVPQVIVVGDPTHARHPDARIEPLHITLETALGGALTPPSADEGLRGAAERLTRSLTEKKQLDTALLGTLAVAGLLNAGLYGFHMFQQGQIKDLTQQKVILQPQADEVKRLRAQNDTLQTQIDQITALTKAKGFLHEDLPLVAGRVLEAGATLQTLSGPSVSSQDDARAFGGKADRAYDLVLSTTDPETATRLYQERGLLADVKAVDCSTEPCRVDLRAAPTKDLPRVPRVTQDAPTMSGPGMPGGGPTSTPGGPGTVPGTTPPPVTP